MTPRRAVLTLGTTQTIGYASSIYLPAILAEPMSRSLGMAPSAVFMALSAALLLQVVGGPWVGRLVDRRGGRAPLAAASVAFSLGLMLLAGAQDPGQLFAGWFIVGLAMAAGLYDAAFAGLVGWFGAAARGPMTGVTLIAGFASTIGWPLTAWLEQQFGWRGACLVWAAANLALALPLHLSLPRGGLRQTPPPAPAGAAIGDLRPVIALAAAFALLAGIGSALAATLPRALTALQATPSTALLAAAVVGPAQVAARLGELVLIRHSHPLGSGLLAIALVGAGVGLMAAAGAHAAILAAGLYGAGIGLFTIVRGALPLALFGDQGYGLRLGLISAPGRIVQAAAPFLFALGLEASPRAAVAALALAAALAFLALLPLRNLAGAQA